MGEHPDQAVVSTAYRIEGRQLAWALGRAEGGMRLQAALLATSQALFALTCLLVLLILVERLFNLRAWGFNLWLFWAAALALSLPWILWRIFFTRRIALRRAAVLADQRLGLNSRLSTAAELRADASPAFAAAFLAEASVFLAQVDPARAFPLSLPNAIRWLPLPLLLALGAWFLPQQDLLNFTAAAKARAERRKADQKLNVLNQTQHKLIDLSNKKPEETGEEKTGLEVKAQRVLEKTRRLQEEQKRGETSPQAALFDLMELKRQLAEEKQAAAQAEAEKAFVQKLKELSRRDFGLEADARMRPAIDALREGDLEKAAEEMRRLAREVKKDLLENKNLDSAQRAALLEKLKKEAEKLAGALADNPELSQKFTELSEEALGTEEFEKLKEEIKSQLAAQGTTPEEMAQQLLEAMDAVAEEMTDWEEEPDEGEGEKDAVDEILDEAIEDLNEDLEDGEAIRQRREQGQGKAAQAGRDKKKAGAAKSGGRASRQKGRQSRPSDGSTDGGPGIGKRPYADGEGADFERQKVKGQLQSGALNNISHFRGEGQKNEVPAGWVPVLQEAAQEAVSSIDLDRVPADDREAVKRYFSQLHQALPTRSAPSSTVPPPPPAP